MRHSYDPPFVSKKVVLQGVAILSGSTVLAVSTASGSPPASTFSVGFVRGASVLLVSPDRGQVSTVLRGREGRVLYDEPAWSSDGRRLAVTVTTFPSHGESHVVAIVGARTIRIPGGPSSFDGRASWAPGGRALVRVGYERNEGGGLYLWRWRSRTKVQLTSGEFATVDDVPAWSPDGSRIAFERIRGRSQPRLYTIGPDGSFLRQLTTTAGRNPNWSPDSQRLVYDDGRRIVVVGATGGNRRFLTNPDTRDSDPAWSPDGRTIAFVRYPSRIAEQGDLWLMNADGTNQRRLLDDAEQPAWKLSG